MDDPARGRAPEAGPPAGARARRARGCPADRAAPAAETPTDGSPEAGLLGAIPALPVTAAARNVSRYLFSRLSPLEETRAGDAALAGEAALAAGGAARA